MRTSSKANSSELLEQLEAVDFALVDMILYLDVNPKDSNALTQHDELCEQRKEIRNQLALANGIAFNYESNRKVAWPWGQSPWPW
ncbi:spore coat protein JB [Paenibacillus sp. 1_12]|uniref:spore coat protein CotJB n=1 Tax=Paenibacillus sp. 1_12 TaxID=1566278 RepID=UPI0008F1650C|nr:spore coat protein CotJB [Paenibacillus sp. 1_12]SFL80948.1 spore coat protein JB [Paenibacillus sp. 1_12]